MLEGDEEKATQAHSTPAMTTKAQDLVKRLFSFSQDSDDNTAALEGAIALAKFGQYERAVKEFENLLANESTRVVAAKNIFRCHLATTTLDKAVKQYQVWLDDDLFSSDQIEKVHFFLQGLIDKEGQNLDLPALPSSADGAAEPAMESEDEILDISSVAITLEEGPFKGRSIDLDVSFQNGNLINLIVSKQDKDLIDNMEKGGRLNEVQYFSPIAIFRGAGIVASKTRIDSGPKKGDFSLDIKIVNP